MKLIERLHQAYASSRRVCTLAEQLASLVPHGASVLDVGCGDGMIARRIAERRPDVQVRGIDVLVRPNTHIPVEPFDGARIPYDDGSFAVVLFVDVLHHTHDPLVLLREAARVARQAILIKDHTANGWLAGPTLRFMDRVGNCRYGVALPYNYWPRERWQTAFHDLDLTVGVWKKDLGLFPWPASWLFGRSLHFIARLEPKKESPSDLSPTRQRGVARL